MSRTRRTDNVGMHIVSSTSRYYGTCPLCNKVKPMHWISKVDFLCYTCLKKTHTQPYYPKLEKETNLPPPRKKRSSLRKIERPSPPPNQKSPRPMSKKKIALAERRKTGPIYKSYP